MVHHQRRISWARRRHQIVLTVRKPDVGVLPCLTASIRIEALWTYAAAHRLRLRSEFKIDHLHADVSRCDSLKTSGKCHCVWYPKGVKGQDLRQIRRQGHRRRCLKLRSFPLTKVGLAVVQALHLGPGTDLYMSGRGRFVCFNRIFSRGRG
jgi:hypothetical protein